MDYEFPVIENISQVLPHIEGFPQINVLVKDGGYTVIDYAVDDPTIFSRNTEGWVIRRECRGIMFDTATGKIIRRPYNKFHNVNQTEETMASNIASMYEQMDTKILMKEDGSMVSPFMVGDKLFWGTRRGETEQVSLMKNDINVRKYENTVRKICNLGITLCFEYVSPSNVIILKYQEPKLILTGARDNITGKYIDIYTEELFKEFDKVVEYSVNKNDYSILELIKKMQYETGIEGVVIVFGNGHRVKLKCEEYVILHKSKSMVSIRREVWTYILEKKLDDLIPFLEEAEREKVWKIEEELWYMIGLYDSYVVQICEKMKTKYKTKKDFALSGELKGTEEKPFVFSYYDGKDIYSLVVEKFLSNCVQEKRIDEWIEYLKTLFEVTK